MAEYNFFGMMDMSQNLFWIIMFIVIVAIGIIWHLRLKRKLDAKQ